MRCLGFVLFSVFVQSFVFGQPLESWHFSNKVTPEHFASQEFGSSVAISGDYAFVGNAKNHYTEFGKDTVYRAGAVFVYKRHWDNSWKLVQKLTSANRQENAHFGQFVAIDGRNAIIGSYYGGDHFFQLDSTGTWVEMQNIVPDSASNFGWSVAIYGKYAFKGNIANYSNSSGGDSLNLSGGVYVYVRENGVWRYQEKLVPPKRYADDMFGWSISAYGDYLVVGSPGHSFDDDGKDSTQRAGAAYVYHRKTNGRWEFMQKMAARHSPYMRQEEARFGESVGILKDKIAVGAPYLDNRTFSFEKEAGIVVVYALNDTIWNFKSSFTGNAKEKEWFGRSISVGEESILVGASHGAFVLLGGRHNWLARQSIESPIKKEGYNTAFGSSVAMSGNNLAITASYDYLNEEGQDSVAAAGAAYFYHYGWPASTGVQESVSWQVYPNPTEGNIIISGMVNRGVRVLISDTRGRLLCEKEIIGSQNMMLEGDSGLYFIRLVDEKGNMKMEKVLKL